MQLQQREEKSSLKRLTGPAVKNQTIRTDHPPISEELLPQGQETIETRSCNRLVKCQLMENTCLDTMYTLRTSELLLLPMHLRPSSETIP